MLLAAAGALLIAILLVGAARRRRHRRAIGLRARWGWPVDRERNLVAVAGAHRSRLAYEGDPRSSLDDRTWADLDMDAVFAVLDRTESTLGQQALYHRLRTTPLGANLDAFDALATRLEADPLVRERAQAALARLQDPHGYDLWWLARPDSVETRWWYVLFPVLSAAALVLAVLTAMWPQLAWALIGAGLLNVLVRYLTDRHILAVAGAFRQVAPVVRTGEALAFLNDGGVTTLAASLRADAGHLRRLKLVARWTSGNPLMLPARPASLALFLNDVVSALYEYANLLLLLDANGIYLCAGSLRRDAPALLRVAAAIGDIDAALSVASVRTGCTVWTRPRLLPDRSTARWRDARHPLLVDPVPNTIALSPGEGALVTGSNMSGKSTFLRTVGVTTVMAQTIATCFASEYEAPVFSVRSCIGRSDDLVAGTSYYVAEVEALLGLVQASQRPRAHLFLLDELFRGTNAVERIAAGHAVLLELLADGAGISPHVAIAATHDSELIALLAGTYATWHFGDDVGPEGLSFDHRLRPGAATSRNAIALLRLHGAPARLTDRAARCAAELDEQRGRDVVAR